MRTMLGMRPYTLAQVPLKVVETMVRRVDAVLASAVLLPPAVRGRMVERAVGLRAELERLDELSVSDLAVRMQSLPGEVDDLEQDLSIATNAARMTPASPADLVARAGGPAAPTSTLGKIGVGVGVVSLIGVGIWAAVS